MPHESAESGIETHPLSDQYQGGQTVYTAAILLASFGMKYSKVLCVNIPPACSSVHTSSNDSLQDASKALLGSC